MHLFFEFQGLLAKKAVEVGLEVAPYIKTSLSPGSGVVTYYLKESGVIPALEKLGFNIVGVSVFMKIEKDHLYLNFVLYSMAA